MSATITKFDGVSKTRRTDTFMRSYLFRVMFTLLVFVGFHANDRKAMAQFRIAVDINQLDADEARLIIKSGSSAFKCEGIFGPASGVNITPTEWAQLISRIGAYRIVSEDVLGFRGEPDQEWKYWVSMGRRPNQGMIYSELHGLVHPYPFPSGNQWALSDIPGFVEWPNVPRTQWPQYGNSWYPSVWDTCIDIPIIRNYASRTGNTKILLLNRDFNDRPPYAAYRTHLLQGLRDPNVAGAVFEIVTNVNYLKGKAPFTPGRNIATGIRSVLAQNKDCFLLLSPGVYDTRTYATRVADVLNELKAQGVPFNDTRLWVVVACYERENSKIGFLKSNYGSNSVEAALERAKAFRTSGF